MKRAWILALIVSSLLALPLAFASIVLSSPSTGSWVLILQYPGFWLFYGKAWFWFSLCGSLASIISLEVIRRRGIAI
jgi:hypothetical protein